MGEVYEAEDLELRERVALKTVLQSSGASEAALGRFKREIQLARKISHPNVCRIFDIGFHRSGQTAGAGDVTFLTMELLAGETLSERIHLRGTMSVEEAFPFVRQLCSALGAAHKAGIIHRDFKSSNVMLVPSTQEDEGTRVVVTDFGLARGREEVDQFGASVTMTDAVVGTPSYMSPEQIEGAELTAATDVYSLGIVMFEMLTGKLPFSGGSAMSVAFKRLKQAAPSPRAHLPGLDPIWEAVILRALERDPALRYRSAGELFRAIEKREPGLSIPQGEGSVTSGTRPGFPVSGPDKKRSGKLWTAGTAALALAIFAIWFYSNRNPASSPAPVTRRAPAPPVRRSVAVVGLRNLSNLPEAAWLETALPELLGSDLAAGGHLRLAPGEDVARARTDLALGNSDSLGKETLARVRKNLGTDFVILGSFLALGEKSGGKIHLTLHVQNAATGDDFPPIAEDGTEVELPALVTRAGTKLRQILGAGEPTEEESKAALASFPTSPEGAKFYAEGIAKLRRYDALGAKEALSQAIAADEKHPLSHAALAEAWSVLGYDAKTRDESKRAFDLSSGLAREERLAVEARYREANHERGKAIEIYRSLWTFLPDNLDYGLHLGNALIGDGKAKEALTLTASLRKLPPPTRDDPRINLIEADASELLGDFRASSAAAASAIEKSATTGSRIVQAAAKLRLAEALRRMGEIAKARPIAEEARSIYESVGDRGAVARSLNTVANILWSQGDYEGAKKLRNEAIAALEKIGNRGAVAALLNNIAAIEYQQGNLAESRKTYERAIAIHRETGNRSGLADALSGEANVFEDQGDFSGARARYEESLSIRNEIGDRSGAAGVYNNLAVSQGAHGDLAGAKKTYEQALAIRKEIGDQAGVAEILNNLGLIALGEGELATADKLANESLEIRRKLGDKAGIATSLLNRGEVLTAGGDLRAAAKHLDEALQLSREISFQAGAAYALFLQGEAAREGADFAGARKKHEEALAIRTSLGDPSAVVESQVALARLALHEGKTADAESAAKRAIDAAKKAKSTDSETRAGFVLAAAQAAGKKFSDADRSAAGASSLAEKSESFAVRFESKLVRSAIDLDSHPPPKGSTVIRDQRTKLDQLAVDGTNRGFLALSLEARLLASRWEGASQDSSGAAAHRSEIAKEAHERGYERIAKRAAP